MDPSPKDVQRRAAELRSTLYPELEHESLDALARRLVVELGHASTEIQRSFYPEGGLRSGDRFSQVSCAALERLFIFDLWSKGVCYGYGATNDPREMAAALGAFVFDGLALEEIERRFPWFSVSADARAHAIGRRVDERWRQYLESDDDVRTVLKSLVRACSQRPRLRALFPFTSHETLLFSRTTGYPYDALLVCARPVWDDSSHGNYIERFKPDSFDVLFVQRRESEPERSLGRGDSEWAARTLEREVPADWGPAIDGTADDLR